MIPASPLKPRLFMRGRIQFDFPYSNASQPLLVLGHTYDNNPFENSSELTEDW
jgi:hypothetical protein